jgi:hypothetical protein
MIPVLSWSHGGPGAIAIQSLISDELHDSIPVCPADWSALFTLQSLKDELKL